jgi:hypothetical protein
MSAKQRSTNFSECTNTTKKMTSNLKFGGDSLETERLKNKISELQNALCVAFDDNDTVILFLNS